MNTVRGMVMVLAAALAVWKGWQLHFAQPHSNRPALLAYALAALALGMAVWHFTRKAPGPRI